jgi:hypothetical protein
MQMNKVRLVLTLITVAITVGPVLGMVLAYQNNLPGLVIPDKVDQIMQGFEDINPENIVQQGPAGTPDVQFDPSSRTFTATFPFQNPLPYDTTIDAISGPMECDSHGFVLGSVSLKNPVSVKAGETATATVQGSWTEAAVNHFETAHQGEQSVKVSLVGATITFGGMTIKYTKPIPIGEIPLT